MDILPVYQYMSANTASSLGTLLSRGEVACSSLFGKCAFNFILQLDIPVSLQIILLVMASEAKAPASHYCDPGSIPSDVTLQCSWTLSRTPIFFIRLLSFSSHGVIKEYVVITCCKLFLNNCKINVI